jgi:putative ABC transport system ATP-binding protein
MPSTTTAHRNDCVIEIRGVSHRYHDGEADNTVLHSVSAAIERGKITLMVGPSGSGKSTLLKLIGGLSRLQTGSIFVEGTSLAEASPRQLVDLRRRIGFIFQAHHLIASLSVLQNVMMPLSFDPKMTAKRAAQTALGMLEKVGLKGHEGKRPAQLSGGMKQRVAVARALVHSPGLILADEPTASLDGKTGQEIVNLLIHISREQAGSVVLVTHDPRLENIADHKLTLVDGHLMQADTP